MSKSYFSHAIEPLRQFGAPPNFFWENTGVGSFKTIADRRTWNCPDPTAFAITQPLRFHI
jgi:hypothetical protein